MGTSSYEVPLCGTTHAFFGPLLHLLLSVMERFQAQGGVAVTQRWGGCAVEAVTSPRPQARSKLGMVLALCSCFIHSSCSAAVNG